MDVLPFGSLERGDATGRRSVDLVTLESGALRVSLLSLGASLHAVEAPDRTGHMDAVCLTLATLDEIERRAQTSYLGTTCGRYANRIVGSTYAIDGYPIVLEPNDGTSQLHGGPDGFSRRIWDLAAATESDDGGRATFALRSPDGDQGHPGTLDATATYELHGHTLRITYAASTDAPTAVSLTNHAYWNLAGASRWHQARSIADHELRVVADKVLPSDEQSLPAGPLTDVAAAGLDLRLAPLLGDVLRNRPSGLDHSFAVSPSPDPAFGPDGLRLGAELHHPPSGRTLTIATDQPAIHVYTANWLTKPFAPQAAVCLETQRFPDAPNRPDLGPAFLYPGERYEATTELTFGVR